MAGNLTAVGVAVVVDVMVGVTKGKEKVGSTVGNGNVGSAAGVNVASGVGLARAASVCVCTIETGKVDVARSSGIVDP